MEASGWPWFGTLGGLQSKLFSWVSVSHSLAVSQVHVHGKLAPAELRNFLIKETRGNKSLRSTYAQHTILGVSFFPPLSLFRRIKNRRCCLLQFPEIRWQNQGWTFNSCFGTDSGNKQKAAYGFATVKKHRFFVIHTRSIACKLSQRNDAKKRQWQRERLNHHDSCNYN